MNTSTEKQVKLIATYARVSTSHQEEQRTIENQIASLQEFVQKNGYTIVKQYVDDGWSGDMLARPALDELRQDAQSKIWDAVLIYDPDRLARRASYQALIMDELQERGIEMLFVTTPTPKNDEDKILYGFKGLFAEYERAKIAERFRLGKLRKLREGHILVSEALYGYTYIPKRDGRHGYYEINEEEARVVRMIFSWVADEHMTLRAVVRKLQALGIKPRKSKRGVWGTSTLSTLLRHKAYIGEMHWGSSYAVVPENPTNKEKYRKMKKSSRRNKPEEEWIASKIPVPVVIDRALFERARAQLATNFALCERNKKNDYLLSGRIQCICGRKRTGEGPQHGKHLYYRCSDRVASFPLPPNCRERGINARIADRLVWQKVANLMSSPDLLTKQAERCVNNRKSKAQTSGKDVAVLQKETAKLKEQEERYGKAYGAGVLTLEQLKEYAIPLRERSAALEVEIASARQDENRVSEYQMPSREQIERYTEAARIMLGDLSFLKKRAIVVSAIEKVIGTQQQLQVYGHLTISNHVEHFTDYRHRRSAQRREIDAF